MLIFFKVSASADVGQRNNECSDGCNTYNCHDKLCTLEDTAVGALFSKGRLRPESLHWL